MSKLKKWIFSISIYSNKKRFCKRLPLNLSASRSQRTAFFHSKVSIKASLAFSRIFLLILTIVEKTSLVYWKKKTNKKKMSRKILFLSFVLFRKPIHVDYLHLIRNENIPGGKKMRFLIAKAWCWLWNGSRKKQGSRIFLPMQNTFLRKKKTL